MSNRYFLYGLLAALLILAVFNLAGCNRGEYGRADGQIVCAMDGRAFQVEPGAAMTSFIKRYPPADPLCRAALKP